LRIIPITITDAGLFVREHHRKLKRCKAGLFAVAVAAGDRLCGVVIVGRPKAKALQDGWTCEITREATDGTPNASTKLRARARRVAGQLGWRRIVTYSLPEEGGGSFAAMKIWNCDGPAGGGPWSREDRPRVDDHPQQVKIRWSMKLRQSRYEAKTQRRAA
jgi:hypothetical protein